MGDAITLAQFYLSEAARMADAATVSVEMDKAERLRQWLVESWPHTEVLPGDILQRAPIRALRDREAVKRAVAALAEAGWLVPMERGAMVRGVEVAHERRSLRVGWNDTTGFGRPKQARA